QDLRETDVEHLLGIFRSVDPLGDGREDLELARAPLDQGLQCVHRGCHASTAGCRFCARRKALPMAPMAQELRRDTPRRRANCAFTVPGPQTPMPYAG